MSEKKYYWLKLQNDFFSHKEIKKLRKIAGGDTYTVIYLKMLLVSLKNDGCLFYDGVEETFAEELALELDEEKDNVDVTLKFLMVHGLIEETSQNQFSLPGTINAIGAETSGNIRVKRHREKLKALQCNDSVTPMKRIVNGEIEKEIDIEIYKNIVGYLNQKAGTGYRYQSEKTKGLIRARLNEGFTEEDFITVIDNKVEEWKQDKKFSKYIRPETLFSNKFEGYLNEKHGQQQIDRPLSMQEIQKAALQMARQKEGRR